MDIAIQTGTTEVTAEVEGETVTQTVPVQALLASDTHNRTVGEWGGPKVDSYDLELEVQTSKPIGAERVKHFPRGNAEGQLQFSATMVCADAATAAAVALSWPLQVPRSGILLVDGTDRGACAVKRVRMKCRGREVTADYEILN